MNSIYTVDKFSRVDPDLHPEQTKQILGMRDVLFEKIEEARREYIQQVSELREAQAEDDAKKFVTLFAFELEAWAMGVLFGRLMVRYAAPEYAMSFFIHIVNQLAEDEEAREQERSFKKIKEVFEDILVVKEAAKNPGN